MTDQQYRLTPMQNTQSIPVHWEFSQDDYDKLAKGRQSNWSIFLRGDVVHVCRAGGEEFYRFVISKSGDAYITDNLEVYTPDDFYESARQNGWTDEKIEQHKVQFKDSTVMEVIGLLSAYFDINL